MDRDRIAITRVGNGFIIASNGATERFIPFDKSETLVASSPEQAAELIRLWGLPATSPAQGAS